MRCGTCRKNLKDQDHSMPSIRLNELRRSQKALEMRKSKKNNQNKTYEIIKETGTIINRDETCV